MAKEKSKWFLSCYDIRDPKRLKRVFRVFKNAGMQMQYSVFVIKMKNQELHQFMKQLNGIIDQENDDIRFYPIRHPGQLWMYGESRKNALSAEPVKNRKNKGVPTLLLGLSKKVSALFARPSK